MPISIALWFGIPIGFLFYFEARWLLRFFLGRYERKERLAARFFGAFGVSLIPLVFCSGLIEHAFPGRLGEILAMGFFMVVGWGFWGMFIATVNEGREFEGDARNY
jgi:hypothetical protein